MWPWEHLAFGYLLYAGLVRLRLLVPGADNDDASRAADGGPVSEHAAVAVAVGTQLPDLVDKPLAWVVGVLPGGVSLAHSVFVAVPVALGAVVVARRGGHPAVGTAFAVGYLSHLAGDLLYPLALGEDVSIWYLAWPLRSYPGEVGTPLANVERFWATFTAFLGSPRGQLYLLLELGFLALAAWLWLRDGTPGLRWARRATGR